MCYPADEFYGGDRGLRRGLQYGHVGPTKIKLARRRSWFRCATLVMLALALLAVIATHAR